LITGHLRPDAGSVRLEDRDITGGAPHAICRMGMGRSFQRANIFPAMTVLENVHAAVLAHGRRHRQLLWPARADREGRARAREILEAVRLGEVTDRLAGTLSHGDQKLLDIALALALQPRLLSRTSRGGCTPNDGDGGARQRLWRTWHDRRL
jgi:branched-chain amino acid transport system ATP-binding protein